MKQALCHPVNAAKKNPGNVALLGIAVSCTVLFVALFCVFASALSVHNNNILFRDFPSVSLPQ